LFVAVYWQMVVNTCNTFTQSVDVLCIYLVAADDEVAGLFKYVVLLFLQIQTCAKPWLYCCP